MKYLIVPLILALVGCTDSKSPVEVNVVGLKAELREAQYNLASCQNSLSVYRDGGSNQQEETTKEETTPAEPQCEEVDYQVISQNNRELATCLAGSVNETPCGIQATDCTSGIGYSCLRDVSYKTITKKNCN